MDGIGFGKLAKLDISNFPHDTASCWSIKISQLSVVQYLDDSKLILFVFRKYCAGLAVQIFFYYIYNGLLTLPATCHAMTLRVILIFLTPSAGKSDLYLAWLYAWDVLTCLRAHQELPKLETLHSLMHLQPQAAQQVLWRWTKYYEAEKKDVAMGFGFVYDVAIYVPVKGSGFLHSFEKPYLLYNFCLRGCRIDQFNSKLKKVDTQILKCPCRILWRNMEIFNPKYTDTSASLLMSTGRPDALIGW